MTLARTHWREIVLTALASLALIAAVAGAAVAFIPMDELEHHS